MLPQQLKIIATQLRNIRVVKKVKLDSKLQLEKALGNKRRAENMVESVKAKGSCTMDSDSNPSVVSRDVEEDTATGVGEMVAKKRSVGSKKYTKNNPPKDPLQRDIREWTNPAEKRQGHNQPNGKGKRKGKG